ncbi:hypothetical protein [Aliamphritea spongicola]|uniref:hypothetical protein n=1 Tax=Aliamphritea spongicola TaxID=707589 RepID=UPI00196A65F6|nr:hypothetical protein [Aliamphritea spongicola]MBN3561881.1 hypothetical protein [Aliamphritea spongicola]
MKLQFITPTLHGVLDYAAAIVLILAPRLLNLQEDSVLVYWFSTIAGAGLILYSLFTDYALSFKGLISYRGHLILDSAASASFILLALIHEGTTLSMLYCLVMGAGVIGVIALSGPEEATPAEVSAE